MPASGFDPCTPERKAMVWKKVDDAVLKAVIVDLVSAYVSPTRWNACLLSGYWIEKFNPSDPTL